MDIKEIIKNEIEKDRISIKELAEAIDEKPRNIKNYFNGKKGTYVMTQKLFDYFKIELSRKLC